MYPDIFDLVADSVTATDLIGTSPVRFWPAGHVRQNEERPYAVHQLVYGTPENTLSCVPDVDNLAIQVDAYAKTVSDSRAVGAAVRDAIEPAAHMVAHNGETWEPETGLYRVSMTFEFWTYRS